jgi:hypothetical protein
MDVEKQRQLIGEWRNFLLCNALIMRSKTRRGAGRSKWQRELYADVIRAMANNPKATDRLIAGILMKRLRHITNEGTVCNWLSKVRQQAHRQGWL